MPAAILALTSDDVGGGGGRPSGCGPGQRNYDDGSGIWDIEGKDFVD